MNPKEKEQFISNLCDSVKLELISKIPRMPENWDGFELRELIAEKFKDEAYLLQERKSRYKEYKNDIIVLNL